MPDVSHGVVIGSTEAALFLAFLAAVGGLVSFLFKLLMNEKDKAYRDMQAALDKKYDDMKLDRDFHRDERRRLVEQQGDILGALRESAGATRGVIDATKASIDRIQFAIEQMALTIRGQ